jgi:hypothetical protein
LGHWSPLRQGARASGRGQTPLPAAACIRFRRRGDELTPPFLSVLDTRRRSDDGEAPGLPHQNVRSVQAHTPYLLTELTERTF